MAQNGYTDQQNTPEDQDRSPWSDSYLFFSQREKKDKEEKYLNQFYNYQGYFLAYTKNLNIQSLRKQRTQSKIEACGAAEMIQQPRAHTAHP